MVLFNIAKFGCLKSFASSFHTSTRRLKNVTRRQKKTWVENPKSIRIWRNMTVWDLAKSMRQNMDYVEKVIKPSLSKYTNANGVIQNPFAIEKFLNKEGYFFKKVQAEKKSHGNVNQCATPKAPVLAQPQHTINNVKRPPVVAIMGHVDHGKTTLLDALRSSNIVASEAGGITQHIGAFSVAVTPEDTITFIDTPGHAAFRRMRNRGAEITDIVVLIVAADDGVMEQTVESIKMAKTAGVNIIVAVNKIDKAPEENLAKIKEQLINYGLQAEDLGGDVQVVGISALKKQNLDKLIEAILIEAEMMELKSDPDGQFEGIVVESFTDKRGKLATVLVRRGTLRKRAVLLAGKAVARVRFMFDENGVSLSEATLSQPARIGTWSETPDLGEKVVEVKSEKEANIVTKAIKKDSLRQKNVEDYVILQEKAVQAKAENTERKRTYMKLKRAGDYMGVKKFLMRKPEEKKKSELKLDIIVKGDTNGSVDAIMDILGTYNCRDHCILTAVSHGVGGVTENDIKLAETFDATIYCFNLSFPQEFKDVIAEKNIRIKFHDVIYKFLDDLKHEINSLLPLVDEEFIVGTGEVLEHFLIREKKKKVPVGGCICLTGEFKRNLSFRLVRNGQVIHEGELKCMKHFKNEVKIIKKDQQCGIMFQEFLGDFKTGDKIICYEMVQVPQKVPWNTGF